MEYENINNDLTIEQINLLLLNLEKERLRDGERKKKRKKERRSDIWQSQVEEDKLSREGA